MECVICKNIINQDETGEPYLEYLGVYICCDCYIGLIHQIYLKAGYGDGGLINLIFNMCVKSTHNRKRRISLSANKQLLNDLLHKYKFSCVLCWSKEKLTIDHKFPVAKGGTDDYQNLQILCKKCNSKKGKKVG